MQIIKLSFESFLLDFGLNTLTSLKIFFPSSTISLNEPPMNIFETKKPLFEITVPGKLQSYMISSKPILAMIDGEANRIITESKCGFTSRAEDPKGFAKNILKLADMKKNERDVLGENGRNYALKNYSKKKVLAVLYKLLKL